MHQYVRSCHKCQIMNLQKPHCTNLHQDITQTPQNLISIDSLGPYNITSQGNPYTLTAVCNLMDYLMITPIKDSVLEWNQLLPYATGTFNCFLNEHSKESPHFLYFRCDPYLPLLEAFLQPKLRYLCSNKGMIHLDKLRLAYMLAALNTEEAHSKQSKEKYDGKPQ